MVTENLKKVEKKIESACTRAGRDRNDVTLIAVSKTKPVEMMREAMQCGIVTFGENKVQEIVEKQKELTEPLDWHMIGHLQRNKVKQVVGSETNPFCRLNKTCQTNTVRKRKKEYYFRYFN